MKILLFTTPGIVFPGVFSYLRTKYPYMKALLTVLALAVFSVSLSAQQVDSLRLKDAHTVTEKQMNKGFVSSGLGALSGQSAGVTITSGANRAAMLSAVRVRGTTSLTGGNDPLVIIDGVTSDLSTLGTLYPGDIESFTILKDASETAQYGSRGASGVIQVVTKKGQGGQFRISYDGTAGFESVCKNLDMLSAAGFREWNRSMGYRFMDLGYDSDMPASILRTGSVQNHHIAFSGGTDDAHYRASIGLQDHNTVVRTNAYRNYSAKLDIGQKAFGGRVEVDLGIFGSLQSAAELHDMQHLFYSSAAFNPTFPAGANADGSYSQIPSASQINHPVSLLEKSYNTENAHFNTHVRTLLRLTDRLALTAFGSYSVNFVDLSHFFPTIVWSHGEAYRESVKTKDILGNVSLDYKWTRDRHDLSLTALAEAQRTTTDGFHVTSTDFSTNVFGQAALQSGATLPWEGAGSSWTDPRMVSFLGGATYGFAGKYSLSVNARADASSKFGSRHRWGFFPSASVSWNAIKEPFFRDIAWLDNLKFNAGYGYSGNQDALGPYNSMQLVMPDGIAYYEGAPLTVYNIVRNANPDLRWEVRTTANVGMEAAFARNRIVFTAEFYSSRTRDMLYLYDVSVPPFAFDKLMANLGKMSNRGLEFGLGLTPVETRDAQLNLKFNLSFQQNRLVSLSGWYNDTYIEAPSMSPISTLNGAGFHGGYNDVVYQIVGEPLGVFYLPHCTGLVPKGDGTYGYGIADLDGDGEINVSDGHDRYIAGQATPKAMLGSNISFRYRHFDISCQVNGAFGHKIYNGTSLTYMNMASLPFYNVLSEAPQRKISDQEVTDYWLEKGDYLNIDYVTVGWNLPLFASLVRNIRLSLSVNNLATLTAYSGLTPMINSFVVNGTLGLDDKISFPVYRTYTMAVSIQF